MVLTGATMAEVLQQFIEILVGGITQLAEGIATGVVSMTKALFLEYNEGTLVGLSVFGGVVAIFAGLALAIAITTRVYTWIVSLGN